VNQKILLRPEWGQITVSYTVLPFRRSCATVLPSRPLVASEKDRQINLFVGTMRTCAIAVVGGVFIAPI
jgi:hypothetical protein